MKPDIDAVPTFYEGYINLVINDDLQTVLTNVYKSSMETLQGISEDKSNYAYAEGKWTIKDIVQHLIDSERIFAFRALCFSRGEQQKILGYDHDSYVKNANANSRSYDSILTEFKNCHQSTMDMINSFSENMLKMEGNANDSDIKVLDLIYIMAGHQKHHMNVLRERYL